MKGFATKAKAFWGLLNILKSSAGLHCHLLFRNAIYNLEPMELIWVESFWELGLVNLVPKYWGNFPFSSAFWEGREIRKLGKRIRGSICDKKVHEFVTSTSWKRIHMYNYEYDQKTTYHEKGLQKEKNTS